MVAATTQRVPRNTNPQTNQQIHLRTDMNIAYFENHPELIKQRLAELDQEWDIERMLETGSSAISLAGLALSILRGRKWLIVPLAVQSFLMQHALQGWCPPLPLLRNLGVRTSDEINYERESLRAIQSSPRSDRESKAREPRSK